jgi:hypothetical protein
MNYAPFNPPALVEKLFFSRGGITATNSGNKDTVPLKFEQGDNADKSLALSTFDSGWTYNQHFDIYID